MKSPKHLTGTATTSAAQPAALISSLNVSFGAAHVLKDVSMEIPSQSVVGLVGESGSGKSTLGKTLVGINTPSSGQILIHGEDFTRMHGRRRQELRREVQYIPQDPYSSLSPRRTTGQTLAEALDPVGANPLERQEEISEALLSVKLDPSAADKYPHEFSGGQRQRIAIARALMLKPRLIIADEITSALDVSVQAEIIRLLQGMRETVDSSMLFISHNLAVVQQLCDHVVVMYRGEIVEHGPIGEVYNDPAHHYTRKLLSSVPGAPGFNLD
ncbi:ATP-binding cassette domain-containing protein [Arthrobacter sp. MI7-26]|uniref:ABC transporter ATP-binding protein n=1 Tax=Arthrobacter sp. MI7-26 TaxID=2993653 RepID=UPI002249A03A|nr:ATP-binding cassette domain-containing protein [Arthrobacter sp. MI7-26]MCX2746857.1 ATP-binding cassette domain-containing protein [Arthrobacter sp. MI7-26]